jgi:hypothetical protein
MRQSHCMRDITSPSRRRCRHRSSGRRALLDSNDSKNLPHKLGRRVRLDMPLMRETMDRLSTRGPHLLARNIGEGAPLGAANAASDQDIAASSVAYESQGLPAAAREDGSSGGFPGNGPNRSG